MTQVKLKKLDYILNCDLLNKYIIQNVFELPKFKNLTIKLNLKDITSPNESVVGFSTEKDLKIKAFLLLFYFFGNQPFYKIQKVKSFNSSRRSLEISLKSFFTLSFTNKQSIQNILLNLFIENKVVVNNQGKNSLSHFQINSVPTENYSSLQLLISPRLLENFDQTGSFVFNTNFIKHVNFQFLFMILKPQKVLNIKNLVQNLPFFWING